MVKSAKDKSGPQKGTLMEFWSNKDSQKAPPRSTLKKGKSLVSDADTSPIHEDPGPTALSTNIRQTRRRTSGANVFVSARSTRSSPVQSMQIKPITPTVTPKSARTRKQDAALNMDNTSIRRSTRKHTTPSRVTIPITSRKSPVKDAGSLPQMSPTNTLRGRKESKSPTKRGIHLLSPDLTSSNSRGRSEVKKRRMEVFLGELDEVVPTSNSDERELSAPPPHFSLSVRRADRSKEIQLPNTSPPMSSSELGTLTPSERASTPNVQDMEPEDEGNDGWKVSTQPPGGDPLGGFASYDLNTPSSPEPLDGMTKTARTIAEIKARARAAVPESSDNDQADVPEELLLPSLDSSDDDMEMILPKASSSKTPSRTPAKRTPTSSSRYGLRDRRRVVTQSDPSSAKQSQPRQRNATANPLLSLLREKRATERRGVGADLMAAADHAISRNSSTSFADDEENGMDGRSDDDGSPNQHRFGESIQVSDLPAERMRTPEPGDRLDDDIMQSGDRRRILGEKNEQALGNLLKEAIQLQPLFAEQAVGVPFWSTHGAEPATEEALGLALPLLEGGGLDGPLQTLSSAVRDQDHLTVQMLLDSGLLHAMRPDQLTTLLPWCASTTCSLECPDEVAIAIMDALETRLYHQTTPRVRIFPAVLRAVIELRPLKSTLRSAGWLDEALSTQEPWDQPCEPERRSVLLHRLANFIDICGRARAIAPEDLPDFVLLLLRIGMDPTLQSDTRLDMMNAIGSLDFCIASGDEEAVVAARILAYARGLTLVNQAHMFTILASRIPSPMHRAIRWVACSLFFTDVESTYEPTPPLNKLDELLRSPDGGFSIDNDTDFSEYCHRVAIFSSALTGLEDYISSPAPSGLVKLGEIPSIRTALAKLHGFIEDTRAAHLERSKAKAALMRLAMRLKYQSKALLDVGSSGPVGKPRKITEFFNKPTA